MAIYFETQSPIIDVVDDAANTIIDDQTACMCPLFSHRRADGSALEMDSVTP